jgi:hypothetical protein
MSTSQKKTQNSLTISNKKIIEFYEKNTNVDFENINLLIVDLFENVLQDATQNITKTISSQILTECKENREKILELNNNLLSINNQIQKLNNDLTIKTHDVKKEYIEEMKTLLTIHTNEKIKVLLDNMNDQMLNKQKILLHEFKEDSKISAEMETNTNRIIDKTMLALNEVNNNSLNRITSLVEQNTNHLVERTKNIINDIIPENQEKCTHQIQENIKNFFTLLHEDTKKIITNNSEITSFLSKYQEKINTSEKTSSEILGEVKTLLNKNKEDNISHFIQNFDTKYNLLLQGIQTPIVSVINSSEERINTMLTSLNNTTKEQNISQNKVMTDLEEFLNKYRNSSFKGQLGENHLSSVLTKMFPTAEIVDTSKLTSSSDFQLKRENKDSILIENKDYTVNVDPKEVKKFIGDCEARTSHGIFLSQNTGITSKNNYQIDITNGKILVYVHNCEYMSHKIQIAVDIVDTLSLKLKELNLEDKKEEMVFTREVMEEINAEYQLLISQKEAIIHYVKEFQKNIIIKLEDIRLPKLENILPSNLTSLNANKTIHKCDKCNTFATDSIRSLSAHQRWCGKKGF